MCGFRVGDEVVCVFAGHDETGVFWGGDAPVEGRRYTVTGVTWHDGLSCIFLAEISNDRFGFTGYAARRFRKVQKRNDRLTIEAFMTIKDGFEEPRKVKAPAKREKA